MAETVAVIRDLALILLSILSIILISVLVVIGIQIWKLVKLIRREIPTLMGTARQTLTTVEGTTDFLGTAVARPAIDALGFLASIRRFLHVLALDRRHREVRR